MSYTDIANIIPTVQASTLAVENMKGIPKMDGSGKGRRLNKGRGGCKPLKETGKLVKMGVKNIVGVNLIKATAQSI